MELKLKLTVQFDVSDKLAALVIAATRSLRAPQERNAVSEEEVPVPLPEKPAEAAKAPAGEPAAEEKKPAPTLEEVRAAMHRVRERLEGEDYRNNPDSEGYRKYHRQLTSNFKSLAAMLGADIPSKLPEDKRAAFIEMCEQLREENGEIITEAPF